MHDPEKWGQLATELRLLQGVKTDTDATQNARKSYVDNLRRLRNWADGFYGDDLLSRHAFNRCLTLALLYPILAALLTWAATGQPEIGGLRLAQDAVAGWQRWATVALVLAYFYFAISLLNKTSRNRIRLDRVLTRTKIWLDQRAGFLAKAARWSQSDEDFSVFVGVFVGVADIEQATAIAFFYALLPLLNALADMMSVAATRKFLNLMAQSSERGWNFVIEILLDLLIALLCLFALVWALTQALELWQNIHPASLPFDWRAYRGQIIADPQTGGMLYLMVLTTLLPTRLHVGLGAWGMGIYRGQVIGSALSGLKKLEQDLDFSHLSPMAQSAKADPIATQIRQAYRKGWLWAVIWVTVTLALFLAGIWGGTALLQSLGVPPFAQ